MNESVKITVLGTGELKDEILALIDKSDLGGLTLVSESDAEDAHIIVDAIDDIYDSLLIVDKFLAARALVITSNFDMVFARREAIAAKAKMNKTTVFFNSALASQDPTMFTLVNLTQKNIMKYSDEDLLSITEPTIPTIAQHIYQDIVRAHALAKPEYWDQKRGEAEAKKRAALEAKKEAIEAAGNLVEVEEQPCGIDPIVTEIAK
jgi:hypothetical protein